MGRVRMRRRCRRRIRRNIRRESDMRKRLRVCNKKV